ncbi:MAG: hypothetical protein K6A92_06725 [Lachnospiraceae bacterium]|nr:hypothetical protein [Lachnospiraceae bacterium]
MAKETIDAIRDLEIKTAQAESDAKAAAIRSVQQAEEDAVKLLEDGVAKAKEKVSQALTAAEEEEQKLLAKQSEETDGEIQRLRENAQAKKQEAISAILGSLTGE